MTDHVLLRLDGPVAEIALNRPERHNTCNGELVSALLATLQDVARRPEVHSLVLHGLGDGFCEGVDPELLATTATAADQAAILLPVTETFQQVIILLAHAPKITIAATHGFVVGPGLDLALACDLRVAAAGTQFASRYVHNGLVPDGGATWALPRLIGLGPAMAMLLSGDPVDAEGAYRLGLIHRRVSLGKHLQAAREWGEELATHSLSAQVTIKRLARVDPRLTLDAALKEEREAQRRLLQGGELTRFLLGPSGRH